MTNTIKAVLLDKHPKPEDKLNAKMNLFELILNFPDSKFSNSLLQNCNNDEVSSPWLTQDLKNHFQNLIQKFKEAKAAGEEEKVKWQGYIDIQKITQAKNDAQIEIYNEIKSYKNYVKYLKMSKIGGQILEDYQKNKKRQQKEENNNNTLESLSELIEIREDAFKRVDSEILTQRLRFNNHANEMANHMWNDRLENP